MLNRYAMPGPGPAKKRKGQVPFQGIAPRPSVFLWTLHGPRRFKGPVSSPPYASTSPQRRPLRARGSAGAYRRTRLVPPRGAESASVVQFQQQRRFVQPFQAPRKNSVGSSRPRSPAFAGLEMAHRGLAPQHPPSVRAQSSAPTAVGHWNAIRKMLRHPHRRARRAARECQFPPQFSPLWKPPFPDPPSKLESTKGGETAGGTGTAAVMARLKKPRGPSPPAEPRAAALRVPGPLRRVSPVAPRPPRGQARWSGRGGLGSSHLPNPSRSSQAHPCSAAVALAPLAPFRPRGGGRVGFAAARRPRAEERLQNNAGETPDPLGSRACCPAAGNHPGPRDHPFNRGDF